MPRRISCPLFERGCIFAVGESEGKKIAWKKGTGEEKKRVIRICTSSAFPVPAFVSFLLWVKPYGLRLFGFLCWEILSLAAWFPFPTCTSEILIRDEYELIKNWFFFQPVDAIPNLLQFHLGADQVLFVFLLEECAIQTPRRMGVQTQEVNFPEEGKIHSALRDSKIELLNFLNLAD